ncbi:hypothetical protein D3C86_1815390 [compost metagenome]
MMQLVFAIKRRQRSFLQYMLNQDVHDALTKHAFRFQLVQYAMTSGGVSVGMYSVTSLPGLTSTVDLRFFKPTRSRPQTPCHYRCLPQFPHSNSSRHAPAKRMYRERYGIDCTLTYQIGLASPAPHSTSRSTAEGRSLRHR